MKTRVLTLALCAALCIGFIPAASAAFTDVSDDAVSEAVEVLSGLGILAGDGSGHYYPSAGLTRAQFCKLAVLAEGHGGSLTSSAYRSLFSDVPGSSWAAPYINLAYTEGLVSGYGNGAFGPEDSVTVAQAATVALHLLGWSNSDIGPFWPEDYMSKAADLGLLDNISQSASAPLSRGEAAVLLYNLLRMDTAQDKPFYQTLASSAVSSALLLENDMTAADGTAHTARVYTGSGFANYACTYQPSASLIGRRGTLLLSGTGTVVGFIPDKTANQAVVFSSADGAGLTDENGSTYSIPNSAVLLLNDEKLSWSSGWYDLKKGDTVVLSYSATGAIDLVWVRERTTTAGATVTGYYENASPNTTAPDTITVLGATLPVEESARASLAAFSIGDKLTVTLNASGEVVSAAAISSFDPAMIGVLESAGSDVKVTLTTGISVSGTLYSGSVSELVGSLVRVSAVAKGKVSLSELSYSDSAAALDTKAGTLGGVPLSADVKLYDRVGSGPVTELSLSDLLMDSIPASSIAYAGTNAAGEIDLLVFRDATGNCYSYGILDVSTQEVKGSSAALSFTNTTVAVENSKGTGTAYITGLDVTDGAVAGIAGTAAGKTAGLAPLTKVSGLTRADFDGSDFVSGIPISDAVQVYNSVTGRWVTLAEAKAFTNRFTVYYDRTLASGGQVRVIFAL